MIDQISTRHSTPLQHEPFAAAIVLLVIMVTFHELHMCLCACMTNRPVHMHTSSNHPVPGLQAMLRHSTVALALAIESEL